jgi:archaetidylinositol phosphate synthase
MTIRDTFYPILTPLARPLLGLHPNTISVLALLAGFACGASFWAASVSRWFYLLAAVLIAVSGLLDCFDGIVARETGRSSAFGDFLDHFFDRLVNMASFAGLAFSPNASTSLGLSVAILVLLNSYLGTQIHASFGARDYSGLGKAQLFVALIVGAVVLCFVPDAGFNLGRRVSLVDALFVVIAAATLHAMWHRTRLALRLSARHDADSTD